MKATLLFITLLVMSVQVTAQNFSTKKGGHAYTMDIPDYMTKTYELNDVASLQYMNTQKEVYTVVIEDSKDHLEVLGMKYTDSKDFLDDFVNDYKTDALKRKVGKVTTFESNGNGHSQVELSWSDDGKEFYMLITAVETDTTFYKVLCWTALENKEKYKKDFAVISKSIKD